MLLSLSIPALLLLFFVLALYAVFGKGGLDSPLAYPLFVMFVLVLILLTHAMLTQ